LARRKSRLKRIFSVVWLNKINYTQCQFVFIMPIQNYNFPNKIQINQKFISLASKEIFIWSQWTAVVFHLPQRRVRLIEDVMDGDAISLRGLADI